MPPALTPTRLGQPLTHLEWTGDGLVLWGRDFKVLWGKTAVYGPKLPQLRETLDRLGRLPRWSPWIHEIDMRPGGDPVVRTVVRDGS